MTNDKYDATYYGGQAKKKGLPAWAWVTIILGGIFLLCGGAVAVSAVSPDPAPIVSTPSDPEGEGTLGAAPAAEDKVESYAVGKTFRSGDFQYTIHAVKGGISKVGGEFSSQKAQGAYTRLDVTIKNVTDKPVYFDTDLRLKVRDSGGRVFSADSGANIFGNDEEDGLFTEVNPGNSIRAFAFFDLPEGVKATQAVVSAGLFTFEEDAVVKLG